MTVPDARDGDTAEAVVRFREAVSGDAYRLAAHGVAEVRRRPVGGPTGRTGRRTTGG